MNRPPILFLSDTCWQAHQGPTTTLLLSNRGNAPLAINSVVINGSGFSIAQNKYRKRPAGFSAASALPSPPPQRALLQGPHHWLQRSGTPATGGQSTGTGDTAYGVPTISQVLGTVLPLQTLQINNGPVNLVLSGSNFYPQSIVQLNGVAQQATFTSNTSMQVTIAASSLTALGGI